MTGDADDTRFEQAAQHIRAGEMDALKSLLDQHVELPAARSPDDGGTLLHVAAWEDDVEACRILIDAGALPSAIREKQYCPDHRHAGSGTQTPLAMTLENNRTAAAAYLVTVEVTPDNLWMAASLGNLERLKSFFNAEGRLVEQAADPGKKGDEQDAVNDALVAAAHHRHEDCVRFLLARGADPNGRDLFGMTAMHYAVQGNEPLTSLLIDHGGNIRVKDFQFDATPLGWARYGQHEAIVELLQQRCGEE